MDAVQLLMGLVCFLRANKKMLTPVRCCGAGAPGSIALQKRSHFRRPRKSTHRIAIVLHLYANEASTCAHRQRTCPQGQLAGNFDVADRDAAPYRTLPHHGCLPFLSIHKRWRGFTG